ncbi:hypothetical protein RJ640_008630 [Escallonia rubra]|uniref:Late embryogenesis abundant protein LEA-2 subgroup domain-containing protein n=1 Tax=Escallonia rubra TaxID=112253 RepID=A0AA88S9J8_9ASTE|nr:hypothetical protein RJ640_008630 [Escallonia rubra]
MGPTPHHFASYIPVRAMAPTYELLYYHQIHHHQPPRYLVFSLHRCVVCAVSLLLLLAVATYVLWPSDPDLEVVRLNLDRIHIRTSPPVTLHIELDLTIKVRNPDHYSMNYRSLVVSMWYRGKGLGFVSLSGGHVRPRGESYVDATLELDGVEVMSDVFLLLEDVARGSIPFDTVTEVRGGLLGLSFFLLPLKVGL